MIKLKLIFLNVFSSDLFFLENFVQKLIPMSLNKNYSNWFLSNLLIYLIVSKKNSEKLLTKFFAKRSNHQMLIQELDNFE